MRSRSIVVRRFVLLVAGSLTCLLSLTQVAVATPGARQWTARFDGPTSDEDWGRALGVSPDGSALFVTGYRTGTGGDRDYATVAYNASTGSQLWAKSYDGAGDRDEADALGVSPDGSTVFVTGYSTGASSYLDYATVAYDAATGSKLWVKRYDAGNLDSAFALGVSADGSAVFVTGSSRGSGSMDDYATVAYDASTGSVLWIKRYNGPGNGYDQATALGVSPDGSAVFVTGYSIGSGTGEDYATAAYDASTGSKLWVKRYGPGSGQDEAYALAVSADGSAIFVTGSSYGSSAQSDYATVGYDASTGSKLWAKRWNGSGNRYDAARDVGVSPDGSTVYVTGQAGGSTGYDDYGTVAYDASSGSELWVKLYDGQSRDDQAHALGVSPDGSAIFVTGWSETSTGNFDYATLAYDGATGSKLWSKRYDGPGNGEDSAASLGVRPDGSTVFVTGYSRGSTSRSDFATIAYALI
jgi:outer membrane protein assembly factor BamB